MTDTWIRATLGLAACGLYFSGSVTGITGILSLVIAAVFLLTGTVGSCPFYSLLNISTSRKNQTV